MHEIVTLQFGQQANYLGTHYWNVQESYFTYGDEQESPVDHDISFRQGIGADGSDTYTPRALLYDLKGAFGTLRRENALYELQHRQDTNQTASWGGNTVPLRLPPVEPSPYQQALDRGTEPPVLTTDTVRFWSDYNHIFYHPRSLIQLNEYDLHSSLMPFELWHVGEDLFRSLDREHDLLDRDLRPLLEECDQIQGIQIFSNADDAWGGFAARYLERIGDELGKGCHWLWALENSDRTSRQQQMLRTANVARSVSAVNGAASAYVPLRSTPRSDPAYFSGDPSSHWQTSALQATMVESITLPTRLRSSESGAAKLQVLETLLNNDGKRNVVAAALSLRGAGTDDSANTSSTRSTGLTNCYTNGVDEHDSASDSNLDVDLFPSYSNALFGTQASSRKTVFSQLESLRGAWGQPSDQNSPTADARDRYGGNARTMVCQTNLCFPILSSFPSIYRFGMTPSEVEVQTRLTTSSNVADMLRALSNASRLLVQVDEREALCDSLTTLAEEYVEGWEDFSDSDDDD